MNKAVPSAETPLLYRIVRTELDGQVFAHLSDYVVGNRAATFATI